MLAAGDYFAFVFDEEVVYAEVLAVLDAERLLVRAFFEHEPASVEINEPSHVTHRLSRALMDLASRAGWPADAEWLRRALMN
jgi:hypothetical protein